LDSALSISMSLDVTLKILGLPFFSGVFNVMVLLPMSICFHVMLFASPALIPVSLSSCRKVAVFFPHPSIKASISCSVGMKGSFRVTLQSGACHFCLFSLSTNTQYKQVLVSVF